MRSDRAQLRRAMHARGRRRLGALPRAALVGALTVTGLGCVSEPSSQQPSAAVAGGGSGASGATGPATPPPSAAGRPGDASTSSGAGGSAIVGGGAAEAGTSAGSAAMGGAGQDAGAAGGGGGPADAVPPAPGPDTGSAVPDAGPAATEPCPASSMYMPGNNRGMLAQGTTMRRYNVYVPSTLPPGVRAPLVLDFHGNGSSGMQAQSGSGWQQKADREGFIVAFPDGVGNGWNVGNCCGRALSEKIDDVGFARAIVAAVSGATCIDPKRVYATGISNGAGLSHRLACEAADVFAAIAAASADLVTDPCTPARPISELSVRGESDTLVAYAGGNTGSTGWYSPGAKGTLELWKAIELYAQRDRRYGKA